MTRLKVDLAMQYAVSGVERTARWVLAATTLILLASMGGGFLLLPLLVPAHLWAARRSRKVGRVGWSVLSAASPSMVAWAAVYVIVGEAKPAIWLVPAGVMTAAILAALRLSATSTRSRSPATGSPLGGPLT